MPGREEERTRLLWRGRGEPKSRPTELLESFSFATCLFVALKSDIRGWRLIFRREFGHEKERRTERRKGNTDGENPGALPRQSIGSEFIEERQRSGLRLFGFRFVFEIQIWLRYRRRRSHLQHGNVRADSCYNSTSFSSACSTNGAAQWHGGIESGGGGIHVGDDSKHARFRRHFEKRRMINEKSGVGNRQIERGQRELELALVVPGRAARQIDNFDRELGCFFARSCLVERKQEAAVGGLTGPDCA